VPFPCGPSRLLLSVSAEVLRPIVLRDVLAELAPCSSAARKCIPPQTRASITSSDAADSRSKVRVVPVRGLTALNAFDGGLDLLVHSVAFAAAEDLEGRFTDTPRDRFWLALDVSAYSLVACALAAEPLIAAGPVRTLTARSIAGFPTMEAIVEERAPLHRPVDADDVGAAAYLLGDDARNATGKTLYVDSGYHAMGM
jgi:hypothetical protein